MYFINFEHLFQLLFVKFYMWMLVFMHSERGISSFFHVIFYIKHILCNYFKYNSADSVINFVWVS